MNAEEQVRWADHLQTWWPLNYHRFVAGRLTHSWKGHRYNLICNMDGELVDPVNNIRVPRPRGVVRQQVFRDPFNVGVAVARMGEINVMPPDDGKEHRYVNQAEIRLRLNGTIVRWEARPVMAYAVDKECYDVKIKDLVTGKTEVVSTDDSRLDISSPPLGYVNSPCPVYAIRGSDRLQQQGISLARLRSVLPTGDIIHGWDFDHKELGKSILGEYPSYEDAKKSAADGKGLAFGRRFAIFALKGIPILYGRGQGLGLYDIQSDTLRLRSCLTGMPGVQKLEEYGVRIRV